ncbi:hypothetical protein L600_000900000880 [Isoptericola variabilis J7]|nr:hypothetical protein L600_000900000880 [Isoptericola variabilis J7]
MWSRLGSSVASMRMPSSPAPPSSSAHSDHTLAATTPTDTSVSMVDAPCRAARTAATWNGHAPQVTTGSARAATTHCQPVNWRAGIIDRASTGTVSTADTRSRRSRSAPRYSTVSETWWAPAHSSSDTSVVREREPVTRAS